MHETPLSILGAILFIALGVFGLVTGIASAFMKNPEKDCRIQWFGPKWDAPITEECDEAPTPLKRPCIFCHVPIGEGAQGILMRSEEGRSPAHLSCFLRAVGVR